MALFPELCLTGYSIEDLLLQDAVLDGAEAALATVVAGSAELLPLLVVGVPLRHRHRVYNCAVVVHRGRLLGVVPKSYLPTYREFYEGRQLASGADERGEIRVAGAEVPFGPDLLFAADDVPGLVVHAEICEDMWIPVPPSAEAALAGATVLLNLSGSPITVGRAEDRKLLCRSASSRCLAAYAYAAAGQGESTTDLSWDGQTMIHENGVLLAETRTLPRRRPALGGRRRPRPARPGAPADGDVRRQPARARRPHRRVPPDRVHARPARRRPRAPPDRRALPVRARRPRAARPRLLRGLQHPGRRPPAAAGGDRRPEGRHRRVRRARLDAGAARRRAGDGPGRPPAQRHPRLHAPRLRDERGDEAQRAPAHGRARRHGRRARHHAHRPAHARGDRAPLRRRRAGLRRDLRERPGRPAHGLPVPDRQPARRDRARHGRPLRARARLGHVRRRRPDEPLQRQRRHPEDAHPAPHPLGDRQRAVRGRRSARRSKAILDTEISPELVPGDELQSTESAIGPYALHDFTLFHTLRYGLRPSKIALPGLARVARRRRGRVAARLPRGQARRLRPARDPPLARGLLPALLRLRAVQALRAAQRPEGVGGRLAVAAGRLARAVGRLGRRLAARPRSGSTTPEAGA